VPERLPDWLRRRANVSPDHPAIEFGHEVWSFRELDARADATAQRLRALGIAEGDRVALLAANSAAFAQAVFGAARAGAVLVPLNLRLTRPEIEWQLADCDPAMLVTDREEWLGTGARPHPDPLPEGEGIRKLLTGTVEIPSVAGAPSPRRLHVVPLEDVALAPLGELKTEWSYDSDAVQCIMYTSGTSGRPKGAMLTYGNFFWSAFGSMTQLGIHEDDRWLACLPLFHVGGMSILFRSVLNGTTCVIHNGFDAARANEAIDKDGVTIASLVSTMLIRMLAERGGRAFPPSLRCVLIGGGPVPRELVDKGLKLGIPIAQTYGLTETASQATTLRLSEATARPGSAGKPLLPVALRILREDGSECVPLEAGEIVVQGPNISPGYWRQPDATAQAMRGGWLHTGDAGYFDSEGYLYVLDRRDDLIVTGGENVYPAEVESVLSTHPAVREAGVYAMPDATWGQTVAAAVIPEPGAEVSVEALQAYCRERLAGYKVPSRVLFTEDLPRTASGKLLRRELRRSLGGE
jgi:O-succinylbenzoic acid--CoA ligase